MTVRHLGRFLPDVLDVPAVVVDDVAEQVGAADLRPRRACAYPLPPPGRLANPSYPCARSGFCDRSVTWQVGGVAGLGLAVEPGDVGLELGALDPPLPPAPDLHSDDRAVSDEGVHLGPGCVELVGHLVEGEEAR